MNWHRVMSWILVCVAWFFVGGMLYLDGAPKASIVTIILICQGLWWAVLIASRIEVTRRYKKPIEATPCRMCCENNDGVPEVAMHWMGLLPLCDRHYREMEAVGRRCERSYDERAVPKPVPATTARIAFLDRQYPIVGEPSLCDRHYAAWSGSGQVYDDAVADLERLKQRATVSVVDESAEHTKEDFEFFRKKFFEGFGLPKAMVEAEVSHSWSPPAGAAVYPQLNDEILDASASGKGGVEPYRFERLAAVPSRQDKGCC